MRIGWAVATLLGACAAASVSVAGPYADDLGKCFVKSASPADNSVFMQWLFDAISLNPSIAHGAVSENDRRIDNQKFAQLVSRFLFKDCRAQAVDALKYEGSQGMFGSFSLFGQTAAAGLMRDPKVSAEMGSFDDLLDKDGLKSLAKDAGVDSTAITGK